MRKGLTLVEVILAVIVLGIIIVSVYRSYYFFLNNIAFYLKRSDVHMEMDYSLENIRLHLLSAIRIDQSSYFDPGVTSSKTEFGFTGEADYSRITPDNETDNAHYRYFINSTTGDFTLETVTGTKVADETLVSGYLNPQVNFTYTQDTEPNFLSVTVEAGPKDSRLKKTEGMRLWFVDVVK